jgi:hypothetical protein
VTYSVGEEFDADECIPTPRGSQLYGNSRELLGTNSLGLSWRYIHLPNRSWACTFTIGPEAARRLTGVPSSLNNHVSPLSFYMVGKAETALEFPRGGATSSLESFSWYETVPSVRLARDGLLDRKIPSFISPTASSN